MKVNWPSNKIFNRVNRDYFDSNLPPVMVMVGESKEDDHITCGGAITYMAGPDDIIIIVLDRVLFEGTAIQATVRIMEAIKHECIHIRLGNPEHGEEFQKECEKLNLNIEDHITS